MKEVVLQWRGQDITVKYDCINYGGNHYAIVIDKNGKETRLHKRREGDHWMWRGGINESWPEDLIILLSDLFNQEIVQESKPDNFGGR